MALLSPGKLPSLPRCGRRTDLKSAAGLAPKVVSSAGMHAYGPHPAHSERKKLRMSCFCSSRSALKFSTTAFASEPTLV